MSDVITLEKINMMRDDKIINGYIRNNFVNDYKHIPQEIINLCLTFYHEITADIFKHYHQDNYGVSEDNMTVTKCRGGSFQSLCYGSLCIPSTSKCIHSWRFKIMHRYSHIAIGIAETKYLRVKEGHFNDSGFHLPVNTLKPKFYALWHDGDRNYWGQNAILIAEEDAQKFHKGDIVCMTLDLSKRELSYQINENDTFVAFTDICIGAEIVYCMCVCLWSEEDSVRLE